MIAQVFQSRSDRALQRPIARLFCPQLGKPMLQLGAHALYFLRSLGALTLADDISCGFLSIEIGRDIRRLLVEKRNGCIERICAFLLILRHDN